MTKLSERLYSLRKLKGLTQEDTADQMNVAYRSYRRYESGEREPDASTLVQMADYYGVTIDYLVGRTDDSLPPCGGGGTAEP